MGTYCTPEPTSAAVNVRCTEPAAWQVQLELASPFVSKPSCLSKTASCWLLLIWNPGCKRQSVFLAWLGHADPMSSGTQGISTGQGRGEQSARHRACPAPGWARGQVLRPPMCRGVQAGLRTCSFSFFRQLAEHWQFTLLQHLWFCPGTWEQPRFPSALGDWAAGLWLRQVSNSQEM